MPCGSEAIGGLKEKTMAAMRAGVSTVIIPADNEKDLEDIDPDVRTALNFVSTDHLDKILDIALNRRDAPAEIKLSVPDNGQAPGHKAAGIVQ